MPNLDFSTLVPRHDTFTDADGKQYEFIARVDFGAIQMARFKKAQVTIQATMEAVTADPSNEEAAVAFEQAVNDALSILLPGLPLERLAAFTLGQKNAIITFWNGQQEKPAGEALAGQSA